MPSNCNGDNCDILGCVDCVSFLASRATVLPTPSSDRVSRAKRHLEQSNERVKKARMQARKDLLAFQFLQAKQELDERNLELMQWEDGTLHNQQFKTYNIDKCRDKRQLALYAVVKAEEAILDNEASESE